MLHLRVQLQEFLKNSLSTMEDFVVVQDNKDKVISFRAFHFSNGLAKSELQAVKNRQSQLKYTPQLNS
jgi:hypothetical protein